MKSKYDNYVKPYLLSIKDWSSEMNDKQIAFKLGISERTFNRYKEKHKELNDVLIEGRRNLKAELKDKYIDIALNGLREKIIEKTTIIKDDDGNKVRIREITKKTNGNIECLKRLLNNYDSNWHEDDMITIQNRKDEIDIKKNKFKKDYPNKDEFIDFDNINFKKTEDGD